MKKLLFILAALFLVASPAHALVCSQSQIVGEGESCWTYVTVASNETNLISRGTVLVYDVANAEGSSDVSAYQVRYATASAQGVYVAGVAQQNIVSGASAMVLVRGKGYVKLKTTEAITSGNALWVSTSGDSSTVSSTTQNNLGFALETSTASGNTFTTKKAYITIV